MIETATDPDGVIHKLLVPDVTICGKSAVSWSRFVTDLQLLGLAVFCEVCFL